MAGMLGLMVRAEAGCHWYSVWRYPRPQECGAKGGVHVRAVLPPARPYEWEGEPLWSALAGRIDLGGLK